jgi:repressor LexA
MPETPLTARQQEILALIEASIAARGIPPTRAEIAQALGFRSPNAAEEHLRALERKGAIAIDGSHRGLRVLVRREGRGAARTRADATAFSLPLIGRVAAGQPILAEAHVERQFRLDPELFRPRPDYLLRVAGASMRDAGILDGDLVAVKRSGEARNGQIVVARIEDEATVKRFERRGQGVRLLPANPEFAPIEIDSARVTLVLEGLVVGVLRAPGRVL